LDYQQGLLEALLLIDNLRISLSAVKQFYNTYFQINNKWFDVVDSNLRLLLDNGKHLRIDYLLSERTCRKEQLAEFINYVNELTEIYGAKRVGRVTYIKELGSAYKGDVTEALAELRHLEKFNSNSDFALTRYIEEQNKPLPPKCLIARYHMFVKSNGDTYPCCVSGGEVNENFDARLKLGNMLSSENLKQNLFVDESFAPCRDCFNKYKAINERIINLDDELNSINY
jgi:MoaA/NifB/PqqE/SkfB family radical SAM enzyme